ncbi:unnamed protein product, partial [marine sediment metagenome]
LLQDATGIFAKQNNIEIFPHPNKPGRLPLGYGVRCIDDDYVDLEKLEEFLYWFQKLDPWDLKNIPIQQESLDLVYAKPGTTISYYEEGKYLLHNGLQMSSSRHSSQFKMIYYLWRRNTPPQDTMNQVWDVIRYKHNGFSNEILSNPNNVKKEIIRQTNSVYERYDYSDILPDDPHNYHRGYTTKPDITDIIRITEGNMSLAEFLYNLVKYCYPRRHRNFINIHSDKLIEWSSRDTYLKYLDVLIRIGIVIRSNVYSVGRFSKRIQINWNYRNPDGAILFDNRSPETFRDAIKQVFESEEFKQRLKEAGRERTSTIKIIQGIYRVCKNSKHI